MKIAKIFFTTFVFLFSAAISAKNSPSPVAQLNVLLNQFHTYQAYFLQKTVGTHGHIAQQSKGVMMLKRPGRFRWETFSPSHQVVITDGRELWVYDVDLQQATQQPVQQSAINPAKILSGDVDSLLQEFQVRIVQQQDNQIVFALKPKDPNTLFRSILMRFDHRLLVAMQIENTINQVNVFTFSQVRLNHYLSSDLFEFKAPKGVEVLR